MSAAAPLRWGFLGASRIGRRTLAPAVLAAGDVMQAVAARDLDRAEAFAAECGAHRAYAGYAPLIDDPAVDAVYIALTNDAHLPWMLRALEAGKHVLCEKPLAMNAAEVVEMIEAERRSGRRVLEAFAYRFGPQMERVQEILRAGTLGRIVSAHVSFGTMMPDDDFRWTASLGGGALYDMGCYCVDLLRVAAGAEPVQVTALQRMRGEVDVTLGGMLDFANGAFGQFVCSFAAARSQHLAVNGTEGALLLDWPIAPREPIVTLKLNGVPETIAPFDPYRAMVQHFGAAIRGEVPLRHPLAHSLAQARTLDALFASAREGGRMVVVSDAFDMR